MLNLHVVAKTFTDSVDTAPMGAASGGQSAQWSRPTVPEAHPCGRAGRYLGHHAHNVPHIPPSLGYVDGQQVGDTPKASRALAGLTCSAPTDPTGAALADGELCCTCCNSTHAARARTVGTDPVMGHRRCCSRCRDLWGKGIPGGNIFISTGRRC